MAVQRYATNVNLGVVTQAAIAKLQTIQMRSSPSHMLMFRLADLQRQKMASSNKFLSSSRWHFQFLASLWRRVMLSLSFETPRTPMLFMEDENPLQHECSVGYRSQGTLEHCSLSSVLYMILTTQGCLPRPLSDYLDLYCSTQGLRKYLQVDVILTLSSTRGLLGRSALLG